MCLHVGKDIPRNNWKQGAGRTKNRVDSDSSQRYQILTIAVADFAVLRIFHKSVVPKERRFFFSRLRLVASVSFTSTIELMIDFSTIEGITSLFMIYILVFNEKLSELLGKALRIVSKKCVSVGLLPVLGYMLILTLQSNDAIVVFARGSVLYLFLNIVKIGGYVLEKGIIINE